MIRKKELLAKIEELMILNDVPTLDISRSLRIAQESLRNRVIATEGKVALIDSISQRLMTVESWISTEVPNAEIEYAYTIEPSEEGAWSRYRWRVTINNSPVVWRLFKETEREVGSGPARTHAEAWAGIRQTILTHKAKLLQDRAFTNMCESKGTVKW